MGKLKIKAVNAKDVLVEDAFAKRVYAADVISELSKYASKDKASVYKWFFKTGKGQYGEGDVFIGVTVPNQRIVAKAFYSKLSFDEYQKLLSSKIHEHRLTALIMLVYLVKREKKSAQAFHKKIYTFYMKNLKHVNNWDLVDSSARDIVGKYLFEFEKESMIKILSKMAKSKYLWERRVAIISTFYAISKGSSEETLSLANTLLHDTHDLMHKAVGWTLREMGKKDMKALISFLDAHAHNMPRITLRYSIERLSNTEKSKYMAMKSMNASMGRPTAIDTLNRKVLGNDVRE